MLRREVALPSNVIDGVIALWGKSADSVALLNTLGEKPTSFYRVEREFRSRTEDSEAVDFIVSAITQNPSLVGLRSLLAMMAKTRRISGLGFSLANLMQHADPAIAKDATILEICRQEVDETTIRAVVESIPKRWSGNPGTVRDFVMVFGHNLMASTVAPITLELLWEKVQGEMSDAREHIIELMTGLLGQRVTRLQEERIWNEMEFPPNLQRMLTKQ
jgi:hypothetical protein